MPRTHTAYPREFREQMVALVRAGRKPADNRVSPRNPPGETRIRSCPSLQRAACYLLRLMLLSVLSRKRMAS